MTLKIIILGAGSGGLELSAILSDAIGDQLDLTLVDKNDAFYFGFSKFEVMFAQKSYDEVRIPYSSISKPGVRFLQADILEIDPVKKRVTTNKGILEADVLVIALGASYDLKATPGFVEGGYEFYTLEGAESLRKILPGFTGGRVVIGVTGMPFKCPPAPCEAALLMHDYLVKRGCRDACQIDIIIPTNIPVKASIASSKAIIVAFAERKINFIPQRSVKSIDPLNQVAILDNADEIPYDLFLGIPVHCVPQVVEKAGLTVDGWIPVDADTAMTDFSGVYAIGDVTSTDSPKAGVFAEEAARIAGASILVDYSSVVAAEPTDEAGSCYIDFGEGIIGRVDVQFRKSSPGSNKFVEPSKALAREKQIFRNTREKRWFSR